MGGFLGKAVEREQPWFRCAESVERFDFLLLAEAVPGAPIAPVAAVVDEAAEEVFELSDEELGWEGMLDGYAV